MARPGDRKASEEAVLASMARRAKDLGRVELPENVAVETRKKVEAQLGYRCGGCGERIGVGLKFTRIDIVAGPEGRPTGDVSVLAACNGANGCDFAEKAREGADIVEMIEFVFLTGDAPVAEGDLDADVEAAEKRVNGAG